MTIDLHIHTTASDGDQSPAEVVEIAYNQGLRTISITDHENTAGYESLRDGIIVSGLELIPGVELQAWHRNKEVHILGYFIDVENTRFQNRLKRLREERTACAMEMVKKVISYGYEIEWEQVLSLTAFGGPVSKGHIMQALKNKGYVNSKEDAIRILGLYLNEEGKAYCGHNFTARDAIELILAAEGMPVLAHPGLIRDDEVVIDLIKSGIMGLEVYYYYFGPNREQLTEKYRKMALDAGLYMTGGSDYHGTITPVLLGELNVPDTIKEDLYRFTMIRNGMK